jgi:hypothetical protein
MDVRVARAIAIMVVLAVVGGLALSGRARQLERRLGARPAVVADAREGVGEGEPDSARAVALAVHAYLADHAARGVAAGPVRVLEFGRDSTRAFSLLLVPRDSGPGARAVVHVLPTGQVELRRLSP